MERRLLKDFHIGIVEGIVSDVVTSMKEPKDVFTQIAKAMGRRKSSKDWNALVRRKTLVQDHIGSAQEAETARQNRQSLRKHIVTSIKESVAIDHEKLLGKNDVKCIFDIDGCLIFSVQNIIQNCPPYLQGQD